MKKEPKNIFKNKTFRFLFFALILPAILGFWISFLVLTFVNLIKFPIDLSQYQPRELTKIYDLNGEIITTLSAEKREIISLEELPEYVANATLALEDPYFYYHKGILMRAIIRAFLHNIRRGRISQGGSTLTQQLAKNMSRETEKKYIRKLKEAFFAIKIEKEYTKNQILELYLNQINYGHGHYGIALAARSYFGKHPSQLTIAEAALLAGIPQRPSYYYPKRNLHRALEKQKVTLKKMLEHGFITQQEHTMAFEEEIIILPLEETDTFAAHFKDHIISQLIQKYGYATTFNGGLKVYTTLRLDVQGSLEKAMSESQYQGGIITLDPNSGAILGMVGSRDYDESKFNRTTQARRQCGSAFKVFLYTAYIRYRIGTLADIWNDTPIHFPQLEGRIVKADDDENIEDVSHLLGWVPRDYAKFSGPVTIYESITQSVNIVAIKVLLMLGIKEVIDIAHEMGIKSYLQPVVSLPLGANDVTPLEMAVAFSSLANGGYRVEPYSIVRIEDQTGKTLEEHRPIKRRILDEQTAYIMNWVMKRAVTNGTGGRARILNYPIAGKTGTTNNYTDAWFVGYTPNYTTAVFMGNDDPQISLGDRRTGGAIAAPVWRKAMEPILKNEVPIDFPMPSNIVFLDIDRGNGLLASNISKRVIKLPFISGTEPTKTSTKTRDDLLWDNLKDIKWLR